MEYQSITEATATYARAGFRTVFEIDNSQEFERVMQRGRDLVLIRHVGYLRVEAIECLDQTD